MGPAKKILVVDDDSDLLNITSTRLKQAGFDVITANNGKEGLDIALAQHPSLILLDVMMPEMTGMEMLKSLRNDDWGKTAHVFMLTSMSDSKDMSQGLHYNVDKYILKSNIKYDQLIDDIKLFIK